MVVVIDVVAIGRPLRIVDAASPMRDALVEWAVTRFARRFRDAARSDGD